MRGVRLIERSLDRREEAAAEVARGDSAAVRSTIANDGRTPLAPSRRWPTAWIGCGKRGADLRQGYDGVVEGYSHSSTGRPVASLARQEPVLPDHQPTFPTQA